MISPRETEGTLDGLVGSLSRSLASRLTRRSVIARVGQYGAALSLGAVGAALMDDTALAVTQCSVSCPYCDANGVCNYCGYGYCNFSIWCSWLGYTPHQCPSFTCECGSWQVGQCANGQGLWYGDCCGGCAADGSNCQCVVGNDYKYYPSCCNTHEWTNGWCSGTRNQCGGTWHIYCRRSYCA